LIDYQNRKNQKGKQMSTQEMSSQEMLQKLIIQTVKNSVFPVPEYWVTQIQSVDEMGLLQKMYFHIMGCSNPDEIGDLIFYISSTSGKNALKYRQNYDAVFKCMAQEFRGKTLEIFDVPSGKIVDVFTFEPVEIRMQMGRLDLIFRDDKDNFYHCEEQRHMTYDDFLRCSVYHFQAVRQFGINMTDIILISGKPYNGPKELQTQSGTYKPIFIDFTSKDGHQRLAEIKESISKEDYSNLIELVFIPLYGQDGKVDRDKLAREVIDYELDLLRNEQIYEKLIMITLVLCNKILDKHALENYYEEVKNMLKILQIAMNDGMQKGMQQGMQQGILQNAKEMVVAVLEEKLGAVPGRIIDQIRSIDKHEVLSGLHRQAVRSNNFDAFEGQLKFATS
jgi:hypothetical protein